MALIQREQLPASGWQGLLQHYQSDVVAGFLVFLIALPLCLGIAMASGFPPLAGIITAIVGGLWVGLFTGSPLSIKGPAAGLITIVLGAVETLGQGDMAKGYRLTLSVIVVSGILQVLLGIFRAGSLSKFFPPATIRGMLAAIGIIIISKQLPVMLGVKPIAKNPLALLAEIPHIIISLNPKIALIGCISLLILIIMPFIKVVFVQKIPAPLVVALVSIYLGHVLNLYQEHHYALGSQLYRIGPDYLVRLPNSIAASITFPDFSAILNPAAWQYIIIFAFVGSLESLLTIEAIDQLDFYKRQSDANKALRAIGMGNVICGLIGGLPMIAEVVRSSANVNNGAKTSWANWFHGLFLLLFVAGMPNLIQQIPLSALAAILVFTGYKLAAPKTLLHVWSVGKEQVLIFITTVIVTLSTDLLVGIASGILVKCLILWLRGVSLKNLFNIWLAIEPLSDREVLIKIESDAIFANYLCFKKAISKIPADKKLIIDFSQAPVIDHTFMEHIFQWQQECARSGGAVEIKGMDHHVPFSAHPLAARKKMMRYHN
ncbi:MAG: SulP family inorganic anion transporter [Cytophagales bacterium]|nr:SulP family inorganic anion transporter [Bernardetiaceae bacterium]MDW8205727.1 SulP family inorganic anion transporter [Cytophagales bacterium]